jgi:hypothetical protein
MHIPEVQASDIIRAVEHYAAYLRATNRDDRPFVILAESLKRKPGSRQQTTSQATPHRAPKKVTRCFARQRLFHNCARASTTGLNPALRS